MGVRRACAHISNFTHKNQFQPILIIEMSSIPVIIIECGIRLWCFGYLSRRKNNKNENHQNDHILGALSTIHNWIDQPVKYKYTIQFMKRIFFVRNLNLFMVIKNYDR